MSTEPTAEVLTGYIDSRVRAVPPEQVREPVE